MADFMLIVIYLWLMNSEKPI